MTQLNRSTLQSLYFLCFRVQFWDVSFLIMRGLSVSHYSAEFLPSSGTTGEQGESKAEKRAASHWQFSGNISCEISQSLIEQKLMIPQIVAWEIPLWASTAQQVVPMLSQCHRSPGLLGNLFDSQFIKYLTPTRDQGNATWLVSCCITRENWGQQLVWQILYNKQVGSKNLSTDVIILLFIYLLLEGMKDS